MARWTRAELRTLGADRGPHRQDRHLNRHLHGDRLRLRLDLQLPAKRGYLRPELRRIFLDGLFGQRRERRSLPGCISLPPSHRGLLHRVHGQNRQTTIQIATATAMSASRCRGDVDSARGGPVNTARMIAAMELIGTAESRHKIQTVAQPQLRVACQLQDQLNSIRALIGNEPFL